jgi:hypothetical protein
VGGWNIQKLALEIGEIFERNYKKIRKQFVRGQEGNDFRWKIRKCPDVERIYFSYLKIILKNMTRAI